MTQSPLVANTSEVIPPGGLIVSCQPIEGGAMDQQSIIVAMAKAAAAGGAVAVRIQGVENVKAVKRTLPIPVIGIVKRDLADSAVRITPLLSDVDALVDAGADIVAFDWTDRIRPVPAEQLLERIHQLGCLAMADASAFDEGRLAHQRGCEFIGSTLSGYTYGEPPVDPDLNLVGQWSSLGIKVIAEGRFNSPELAAQAIEQGAYAVTVGSAITRVELISQWFASAMAASFDEQKFK